MILGGILLLLAGLGLWLLGRHGFAVGHHPICAACSYDLHMLPLESSRCPECGADILADAAIHIGRRRPSPAGILAGGVLSILATVLLLLGLVSWWTQFDGSPYMSVTALAHRMTLPNRDIRDRANRELQRRIPERAISAAQTDALADLILKLQTDPGVTWDTHWGDLLESAHAARSRLGEAPLAREKWERYVMQSMRVNAAVRPRVSTRDPIPLLVTCELKAGTLPFPNLELTPTITLQMDGAAITLKTETKLPHSSASQMRWPALWPLAPDQAWHTGKHPVSVTVTMTARDPSSTISRDDHFVLPIEFVAGTSTALHAPNSAQADEIASAIHWKLHEEAGKLTPDGNSLGKLWISGTPLPCAFRVVLRQGDREWRMARFMVQADDAATVSLAIPPTAPGDQPQTGKAEIVCIPDPDLGLGTVDVTEIWGGEVRRPVELSIAGN